MSALPLKRIKKLATKKNLKVGGIILGIFVAVNLLIFAAYRGRTYPNTKIANQQLGSVANSKLQDRIKDLKLLSDNVKLKYQDKTITTTPDELGMSVDYGQTTADIANSRSWLPLADLLRTHAVPLRIQTNDSKLQPYLDTILTTNKADPVNAGIVLENNIFVIKDQTDGHVLDKSKAKEVIAVGLARGITDITLPLTVQSPQVKKADLEQPLKDIQASMGTTITLKYQTHTKKYGANDIAGWYTADGSSQKLSDTKIKETVNKFGASVGIGVQNIGPAVSDIKQALQNKKSLEFTLVAAPRPTKTFTYCTAARGVDASHLGSLQAKLNSVFADSRGWGLTGQVILKHATSDCNFTVWLSAASQMPTFGSICDSLWSCRVGSNVVINFDRWQSASSSWNAAGGSLEDYRVMVINHETGHWFGFGHRDCGGKGQPAPVMQQQSIDLQGCVFNPWPLASELQSLRTSLGL